MTYIFCMVWVKSRNTFTHIWIYVIFFAKRILYILLLQQRAQFFRPPLPPVQQFTTAFFWCSSVSSLGNGWLWKNISWLSYFFWWLYHMCMLKILKWTEKQKFTFLDLLKLFLGLSTHIKYQNDRTNSVLFIKAL